MQEKLNLTFMNLVLVFPDDNSIHSVYFKNPKVILSNHYNEDVKNLNDKVRDIIKEELQAYMDKLDFVSRIKARNFIYSKNHINSLNVVNFIKDPDEGTLARTPDPDILNFLFKFCYKYNSLNIMYKCLDRIAPLFTMVLKTELPFLNGDIKFQIMACTKVEKIVFKWIKDPDLKI